MNEAHDLFVATSSDVTAEQADWIPPGIANPLGAVYAHAIAEEDYVVNALLKDGTPIYAGPFAGKTGISEPQLPLEFDWARRLKVDLPALRQYAPAVYSATDEYLAGLVDEDLTRILDLSPLGLGDKPVSWIITFLVLGHIHEMMGEISCLKGVQGAKGYPF